MAGDHYMNTGECGHWPVKCMHSAGPGYMVTNLTSCSPQEQVQIIERIDKLFWEPTIRTYQITAILWCYNETQIIQFPLMSDNPHKTSQNGIRLFPWALDKNSRIQMLKNPKSLKSNSEVWSTSGVLRVCCANQEYNSETRVLCSAQLVNW